jgi:cytosine/adenosine deaminase-related metal-dependent hydrolase
MGCFHTTFTCSSEYIQKAFSQARERNARIHMHLAEGVHEPDYCLEKYGVRTVAYYASMGLLDNDVLASQCVQVDAKEIELLAKYEVNVSHQPISNCEVGGGFSPVPEMMAAGVNVALGTDGYVNNFFEVMRDAALIPKARLMDPTIMPAHQVWTMATQNGARALGVNDLGTLKPGQQADLLLISADLPSPLAAHNLADQLLLWRNPSDIHSVMCAGNWLMRDGNLFNVDEKAIRARVSAAADRMWKGLENG